MDKLENDTMMTQADEAVVDIHMEDDAEWMDIGTEKVAELYK